MTYKREIILFIVLATPLSLWCHFTVDIEVARWAIAHSNSLKKPFNALSTLAESQWWLVPSALLWLLWRYVRIDLPKAKKAAFMFIAVATTGIAVNILKIIFAKARPSELKHHDLFGFQWFEMHPHFASYPSGHTTTAFTIATVLTLMFPRYGVAFYLFGALMALSRVLSAWHYPSDVIAGAMLGTVVTLLLYNVTKISFKGSAS